MPDFNNGLGNDLNSDVSKQIRHCTGSVQVPARTKHSCGVISLGILTSLGQPTIWSAINDKIRYSILIFNI